MAQQGVAGEVISLSLSDIQNKMKKPPYTITPIMRLAGDTFVLHWEQVPYDILIHEAFFLPESNKLVLGRKCHCTYARSGANIIFYYSEQTRWTHPRVQAWLRRTLKENIIARANEVLPAELRAIEPQVNLHIHTVRIRKLRNAYGRCWYLYSRIEFDPMLVLLPPEIRREVIIHELCHTVHHNHGKRFWQLHSQLLGCDAQMHKLATDVFYSRFQQQIKWLMR